eukprot:1182662-Prorocentrum_minimum.AAC.2
MFPKVAIASADLSFSFASACARQGSPLGLDTDQSDAGSTAVSALFHSNLRPILYGRRMYRLRACRGLSGARGGLEGIYRSSLDARKPQNPTKSEEYHGHLQGVLYRAWRGSRGDLSIKSRRP